MPSDTPLSPRNPPEPPMCDECGERHWKRSPGSRRPKPTPPLLPIPETPTRCNRCDHDKLEHSGHLRNGRCQGIVDNGTSAVYCECQAFVEPSASLTPDAAPATLLNAKGCQRWADCTQSDGHADDCIDKNGDDFASSVSRKNFPKSISGTPDAATLQTLLRQSADYVPHLIVIGGTCCPAGFRLGGVCDCGRAERQASLRWLADALPGILDATEERDAARKRVGSLTASFLQQANEFSAFREISESKISELRAERSQLRARLEALPSYALMDGHLVQMRGPDYWLLRSAVLRSLEDTK